MPGIQDLDRFKPSFRTIGDEAAVLASRGEQFDDLPLPEDKIDEDLASLLVITSYSIHYTKLYEVSPV